MKTEILSPKFSTLLLFLSLTLMGCQFGTSQPTSSEPTATTSQNSGSNTSSLPQGTSEDDESSELETSQPTTSENELVEGTTVTWPKSLIDGLFSAPARLTIPAYVSPSPFNYQLRDDEDPFISIMTAIADTTGATVYAQQLVTAGWVLEFDIGQMTNGNMAKDTMNTMSIQFMYVGGAMTFRIGLYEDTGPIDFEVSETWPAQAIAAFVAPILDTVPACTLPGPYYYMVPTNEDPFIVVVDTTNTNAANNYIGLLETQGWTTFSAEGQLIAANSTEQLYILATWEAGRLTIIITKDESGQQAGDWTYSSSWPAAAIASVYSTAPATPLPAFAATSYSYQIRSDMLGQVIFVKGAGVDVNVVMNYSTQLTQSGFNVTQFTDMMGTFHYATDTGLNIIVVYGFDDTESFYIATRDYSEAVLPGGGGGGGGSEPHFMSWPGGKLVEAFGATLAGVIPVYMSTAGYNITTTLGENPRAIITIGQTNMTVVSNYIGLLNTTEWTVISLTQGLEPGEVGFFMYDPAHSMMMTLISYLNTVTLDIMVYNQSYVDGIS